MQNPRRPDDNHGQRIHCNRAGSIVHTRQTSRRRNTQQRTAQARTTEQQAGQPERTVGKQ